MFDFVVGTWVIDTCAFDFVGLGISETICWKNPCKRTFSHTFFLVGDMFGGMYNVFVLCCLRLAISVFLFNSVVAIKLLERHFPGLSRPSFPLGSTALAAQSSAGPASKK